MEPPLGLWRRYAANPKVSMNGNIVAATALGAAIGIIASTRPFVPLDAQALARSAINAVIFVLVHALLHYATVRTVTEMRGLPLTFGYFLGTLGQIYASGAAAIATYLLMFWFLNQWAVTHAVAAAPAGVGAYLAAQLAARTVHTVLHSRLSARTG